jgi:hypothetical protein
MTYSGADDLYQWQEPRYGEETPLGYSPSPPAAWPVAISTLVCLPLGLAAALLQAGKAKALGFPTRPYWRAFSMTIAFLVVVTGTLLGLLRHGTMNSQKLENIVVHEGHWTPSTLHPYRAACVSAAVDSHGFGVYRCQVDFTNARSGAFNITITSKGKVSSVAVSIR